MDGFEATRQIRRFEARLAKPATPIIAMTALAMEGDRERCRQAGMDDYISKPIKSQAIWDVLIKYCPEYLTEYPENKTRSDEINESLAPPVLNPSQLLDITDNDEEVIRELIGRFAEEAPILIDALEKAVEFKKQDEIMKIAHKLNGVVANCGGERFFEAGLKIEKAARGSEFDPKSVDLSPLREEFECLKQALGETDWKTACQA
jgi:two-component system, sensor histidine kinase and response regulator